MNSSPSPPVRLSVVVPVYNESAILPQLIERLLAAAGRITEDFEVIFVDDGSHDDSLDQVKAASAAEPRIQYISFARNFGHQTAITAGMDYAAGEAIITIDGDLQDPPELMSELYGEYRKGFKIVYAKRRLRKGETWLKRSTASLFYKVMARLVSFEIPLDVGDYRLISREVLAYLKRMNEYDKFLRGQIAWLGFKSSHVLFDRDERRHGQTNYTFRKMLKLAFNGITGFSDTPLKLATTLGFAVCGISFLIGIYALYGYFFAHNTVPGWASIIISITFLGGVQLLSIGIIGEYISRIISNVRNRPLYVVNEASREERPGEDEDA